MSLSQVSPNLDFWSDTSDVGWGAHLGDSVASVFWSPQDVELLAVERGLHQFAPLLVDSTVAVFVNNSTAVAYLRKWGNSFSSVELHRAEDPSVSRISASSSGSPVHHGEEQCLSGCSVQAQPDPGLRMDSETGSLHGSTEALAVDDRPVCHLVESPMFSAFFGLPRSKCHGYGRSSSELGRISGVCLSTLVPDSSSSEEAPLIFWRPYDSNYSVVASETLVPRTSGAGSGRYDSPPSVSQSVQTASFPPSSSRDSQAVSSCVETLQRFARSQGFSSRVTKQFGFSRCPSSRVGYQAKWSIYRHWCHSVSLPTLPKVTDFLFLAP